MMLQVRTRAPTHYIPAQLQLRCLSETTFELFKMTKKMCINLLFM